MGQVVIHRGYGQSPATTGAAVASTNVVGTAPRFAREDHQHAGVYLAGVSNLGNTLGNTGVKAGRLVLQGTDNITLSQITDANNDMTVLISGAAGGGGGVFKAGISTDGNTFGTSGTVNGQIVFVGSKGIDLSQSVNGGSATLSILNDVAIGATNTGNTAGDTRTVQQTVVIAGTDNVTVSQSTGANSDTLWISAGGKITQYLVNPGSQGASALENGSCQIIPMPLLERLEFDRAILGATLSISTSSNSSYAGTISINVGVYTLNGSTLSQLTSGSTNYQFTNTSNNSNSAIAGGRFLTCPLSASLTPGNYWLAVWARTSTQNANWWTLSFLVQSGLNTAISGLFGIVSNLSQQSMLGSGRFSVSSSTQNVSYALSDIHGGSTAWRNHPTIVFQQGTK